MGSIKWENDQNTNQDLFLLNIHEGKRKDTIMHLLESEYVLTQDDTISNQLDQWKI